MIEILDAIPIWAALIPALLSMTLFALVRLWRSPRIRGWVKERWRWVRKHTTGPVHPACLRGVEFVGCLPALDADQVPPWDDVYVWHDRDRTIATLYRVSARLLDGDGLPHVRDFFPSSFDMISFRDPMWEDVYRLFFKRRKRRIGKTMIDLGMSKDQISTFWRVYGKA